MNLIVHLLPLTEQKSWSRPRGPCVGAKEESMKRGFGKLMENSHSMSRKKRNFSNSNQMDFKPSGLRLARTLSNTETYFCGHFRGPLGIPAL